MRQAPTPPDSGAAPQPDKSCRSAAASGRPAGRAAYTSAGDGVSTDHATADRDQVGSHGDTAHPTIPFFGLIARAFSRPVKAAAREVRRRSASISVVAEESLGNAVLVQAYGREKAEVSRFTEQSLGTATAPSRSTPPGNS
jgi:ABC-type multidrug transport system fused ATPase/permease subunit